MIEPNQSIKDLLLKKSLSKAQGVILAKWFLKETGIDKSSCMCSQYQRRQIQTTINNYLNDNR